MEVAQSLTVAAVAADYWGQEVEQPSAKSAPEAHLTPSLRRQFEASRHLIGLKDALQRSRGGPIGHQQVALIVEGEAATVEIGRSYKGIQAVDHHDLTMVKATFEKVDVDALLHEFMGIVFYDSWRDGNVTLGR